MDKRYLSLVRLVLFGLSPLLSLLTTACYAQKNFDTTGTSLSPSDSVRYKKQLDNKDFFTRITQFSDLSWAAPPAFDLGSEKKIFILSADIQAHFMIGGERMPFVIDFVYRNKVRIFRNNKSIGDSSLPVRTPSFMPGVTFYFPLKRTAFDVYKNRKYVSISGFHHSNGQDHETFLSPGVFNYYNGNFSTNFLELALHGNRRIKSTSPNTTFDCLPASKDCNQCTQLFNKGYEDWIYKIGIEQHFSTAYAQRGTYSRTRLNLKGGFIKVKNWRWGVRQSAKEKFRQIGACYLKELYRVIVNATVNVDKLQSPYNTVGRRINIDAGIFKRIAGGNTSIFGMVGYYGNDPYNIYYSKKYFFIRAGLSLGFFVHTSKLRD